MRSYQIALFDLKVEIHSSFLIVCFRYLFQATFGTTKEELQALVSSSNDFASWLKHQMYELPMSSLRAFYRKHTNPKFEYPYKVGAVSSLPCEMYSRWRKYAITSRDQLSSRTSGISKFLTVEEIGTTGTSLYVWKVDGNFRTVTQSPPVFEDGSNLSLGIRYRLMNVNGEPWKSDCVGEFSC